MNTTRTRIATGVAALIAGGIAAVPSGSAGATVPDAPEPGIPEGVYRTPELTYDQLLATGIDAGFAEADVTAFLGPDNVGGSVVFSLRLADGGWTELEHYDGADEEVGWRGTYEVVDNDTVIATDFCGAITYDYTMNGDELTLDMVDDQCDEGGVGELIAQTIIFETAPFTLVETADSDSAADAPTSYMSTTFVVPFEVTPPEWALPEPTVVLPNFVTWESGTVDRGIRFLVPVNVYQPGSDSPTAPPDDYLTYLLGQSEQGAVFADVTETTVDGLPATIVTATTPASLDGSLGCQAEAVAAEDCFGLQPDLILRMAVIDTGDHTLLVWIRDILGTGERDIEYASFDAMLASIRFRDAGEPTPEVTAAAVATPIDGTWTMNLTEAEMANSPLLYDEHEINDQNWGEFTLTFEEGRYAESQHNAEASWEMTGSYDVEGDVLILDRDDGEHFVMRWHLEGDTLVLERDEAIGVVPTPFIINPWTRES